MFPETRFGDHCRVTVQWQRRWPLGLMAFLGLLALVFPARVWLGVLTGMGLLLAVAYYWARSLAEGIAWIREMRQGVLVVGDRIVERFEVYSAARVPLLWAEILDYSDVPGYTASRVEAVNGESHKWWETQGTCQQRGVFHLGPWEVVSGDPLGIFRVRWELPTQRTVLVYPRVMRLPQLTLPRGTAAGQTRELRPSPVEEVTAAGVRAYRPGDPLRRIHWLMTAHRGHLISRTFDVAPSGDMWIVLDLDAWVQAGKGMTSTEEYGVILAASLAAKMLAEGRAVGLACAGEYPVVSAPRAGTGHLWVLLGHLARVRCGGETPLAALLDQVRPMFGRGRTLVVITPSTALTWVSRLEGLRRRGLAAAVIWLDAKTFVKPTGDQEDRGAGEQGGRQAEGQRGGRADRGAGILAQQEEREIRQEGARGDKEAEARGGTRGEGRRNGRVEAPGQKGVETWQGRGVEERGDEDAEDAQALRAVLTQLGVPVHVVTADFPFEVALKVRRKRTEYRVLPGTGRVVAVEVEEEVY